MANPAQDMNVDKSPRRAQTRTAAQHAGGGMPASLRSTDGSLPVETGDRGFFFDEEVGRSRGKRQRKRIRQAKNGFKEDEMQSREGVWSCWLAVSGGVGVDDGVSGSAESGACPPPDHVLGLGPGWHHSLICSSFCAMLLAI